MLYLCCCSGFDKLRKYSLSSYLTHMSLWAALICSYIPLLAGLELGLDNMVREMISEFIDIELGGVSHTPALPLSTNQSHPLTQ